MKLVLVLLAVLVGIWIFKSSRRGASGSASANNPGKPANTASPDANAKALDMVRCSHCDLHLPASDAVQGKAGVYCSPEHRQKAET
jgi:uncharacterized protein